MSDLSPQAQRVFVPHDIPARLTGDEQIQITVPVHVNGADIVGSPGSGSTPVHLGWRRHGVPMLWQNGDSRVVGAKPANWERVHPVWHW